MSCYIDVFYHSLKKSGEELCGDMVNIIRLQDSTIIVLADGLGSGVKANILATLTSKIAGTMLKEGANIYETVDTIVKTLPVCKVRNIAYSTFTIIKINEDGSVYMAEYDNPPFFLIRNGIHISVPKNDLIINEKRVSEYSFTLTEGDIFTIVSDGVTHAGLGDILNLGWRWENIKEYLEKIYNPNNTAKDIVKNILDVCMAFDEGSPGDDTTVLVIKAKNEQWVDLFAGPPKDASQDSQTICNFMKASSKKIVCGGTAANIVSRELKRPLKVNMQYINKNIPPTATMEGIELVTEGVLTLSSALEIIKKYLNPLEDLNCSEFKLGEDGASKLAEILIYECSHLNLWVGKAINPAHQNPDFPSGLSIKLNIILELKNQLELLGKKVELYYV